MDFSPTLCLILDLRDGMGGAWYDYLDPFYPNRNTFFVATHFNRVGEKTEWPRPKVTDHSCFEKPMVVLINQGVRSGKEALAFQFKKTKRAVLVGAKTKGAFCQGKGIFADENNKYLLHLAVAELFLDGKRIEGSGYRQISRWPILWRLLRRMIRNFDEPLPFSNKVPVVF